MGSFHSIPKWKSGMRRNSEANEDVANRKKQAGPGAGSFHYFAVIYRIYCIYGIYGGIPHAANLLPTRPYYIAAPSKRLQFFSKSTSTVETYSLGLETYANQDSKKA
jgi:hypothetical protein